MNQQEVEEWCILHGYSKPHLVRGEWWAVRDNEYLPESIEYLICPRQQKNIAIPEPLVEAAVVAGAIAWTVLLVVQPCLGTLKLACRRSR